MAELIFLLKDFAREFKQKNISIISAGTAFFFFLSIVPMLLLLCSVIPYLPVSSNMIMADIQNEIPQWAAPFVEGIMQEVFEKSLGIVSFATVIMLFSSSKGVFAMYRGLNSLHNVEEKRNYFVIRLRATVFMFVMMVVVLFSLVVIMISRRVLWYLEAKLPMIQDVVTFFMYFRFWILIFVLGIVFAAIYLFLPAEKGLKLRFQIPGAFLAAALWGLFSWGFSIYTSVVDYSLYGSLSVVVLTLLWMYFCMVIFFFGAFINIYIAKIHEKAFS